MSKPCLLIISETSFCLSKTTKNSSFLLSHLSLIQMAALLQLSLKLNSFLSFFFDEFRSSFSAYPPYTLHSDITVTAIKILNNEIFYFLSGLSSWKASKPDGVLPPFFKNHFCADTCSWSNILVSFFKVIFTFPPGNTLMYSLYLRMVTALIIQTTVCGIDLLVFLKFLRRFLIGKFLSIDHCQLYLWSSPETLYWWSFLFKQTHEHLGSFGETFAVVLNILEGFDRVRQ